MKRERERAVLVERRTAVMPETGQGEQKHVSFARPWLILSCYIYLFAELPRNCSCAMYACTFPLNK